MAEEPKHVHKQLRILRSSPSLQHSCQQYIVFFRPRKIFVFGKMTTLYLSPMIGLCGFHNIRQESHMSSMLKSPNVEKNLCHEQKTRKTNENTRDQTQQKKKVCIDAKVK